MAGVFDWIRGLGGSAATGGTPPPTEPSRAVSLADMAAQGWISAAQKDAAEAALEDLKAVIKKSGWNLGPQFRKEGIYFKAPDNKVPLVIAFQEGKTYFYVCVKGQEDPVALAEIPREFKESWKEGSYKGLALDGRKINLQRYISVMLNSLRGGVCHEDAG